jgi:hypothetical protein
MNWTSQLSKGAVCSCESPTGEVNHGTGEKFEEKSDRTRAAQMNSTSGWSRTEPWAETRKSRTETQQTNEKQQLAPPRSKPNDTKWKTDIGDENRGIGSERNREKSLGRLVTRRHRRKCAGAKNWTKTRAKQRGTSDLVSRPHWNHIEFMKVTALPPHLIIRIEK